VLHYRIAPTCLLNDYDLGDFHMVLAGYLLEYPEYRKFYRDNGSKLRILLDNGAFEGNQVEDKQLLELAEEIQAEKVIAPDRPNDHQMTIIKTMKFLELAHRSNCNASIGMVMHGQGYSGWEETFAAAMKTKAIDFICFSKIARCYGIDDTMKRRLSGVNRIFNVNTKPIHLLGQIDIKIVAAEAELEGVKSIDTSFPIMQAIGNRHIDEPKVSSSLMRFTPALPMNDFQMRLAMHNLEGYDALCKSVR